MPQEGHVSPCPATLKKQQDVSVPSGWPSQGRFYYERVKSVIYMYYAQEVYALLSFGAKAYGPGSWLNA